jgi:hypothetical protein
MSHEQELTRALNRLRIVAGMVMDAADLDPAQCVVTIRTSNSERKRPLAEITLAECFAEADRLVPQSDPPMID